MWPWRKNPEDQLPLGALLRADHGSHTHQHAAAVTVAAPEPISPSALIDLLERPPFGVYRLKGMVAVVTARGAKWWAVNLTGRQIHVASYRGSGQPGLVAIGVRIDEPAVRAALETAVQPHQAADAAGLRRLQRHARLSA
ncbi:GTP-binding protein [Glutamicibacter sp.]|jgi:Putative GTPases (G3E family)|uniref:GTP-binding protein n=1 Tax=Glutamicibacter sp. TaxID=1931995 RepID=UPI002B4A8E8E|nr:GTP-binding protein [Glutamicibacter sp.]HJX77348.1 GTP-binding protein [Glutamicibacter sp.]